MNTLQNADKLSDLKLGQIVYSRTNQKVYIVYDCIEIEGDLLFTLRRFYSQYNSYYEPGINDWHILRGEVPRTGLIDICNATT